MEEQRAEEIEEIIGNPPSNLISWGTAIIVFVTTVFILLGWLITFPEKVNSEVTIITQQDPIGIYINKSAYLEQLLVKQGDIVKAGALMAVMRTEAQYDDVITLKKDMEQLLDFQQNDISQFKPNKNLKLNASIQMAYDELLFLFENVDLSERSNKIDKRALRRVKRQKTPLESTLEILREKDILLAKKKSMIAYRKFSQAKTDPTVKKSTLSQLEEKYLSEEEKVSSIRRKIEETRKEIADINLKIFTLENGIEEGKEEEVQRFQKTIYDVLDKIKVWEDQYIYKAPIDGIVLLPSSKAGSASSKHFYNVNSQLLSVLPAKKENLKLKGIINLESDSYYKVRGGQTAIIEFYGYPSSQYGRVEVPVIAKTELSGDNTYSINVELDEQILAQKNISFVYGMRGEAKILTDEKNIWQRILSGI